MPGRFTDRVKKVLQYAREEAKALNSENVGTESGKEQGSQRRHLRLWGSIWKILPGTLKIPFLRPAA